ncbi:MAG: glycosyltransferase [Geodermatophilaceae bacterium]
MAAKAVGVAVVIPAKDEAARIAATVASAHDIAGVDIVLVVDDGSTDDTRLVARDAGATVVVHERNRGKARAMQTGADIVARLDRLRAADGSLPRAMLFVDADLAESAVHSAP